MSRHRKSQEQKDGTASQQEQLVTYCLHRYAVDRKMTACHAIP